MVLFDVVGQIHRSLALAEVLVPLLILDFLATLSDRFHEGIALVVVLDGLAEVVVLQLAEQVARLLVLVGRRQALNQLVDELLKLLLTKSKLEREREAHVSIATLFESTEALLEVVWVL